MPSEPRGRVLKIVRNGAHYEQRLLPNGDVTIRRRYARRSVTISADELFQIFARLEKGELFPVDL